MKNEMYVTKDQFIASTLFAMEMKLAFSEWNEEKCFLYFKNKKRCERIVSAYYSGELSLDPRVIFDSFKTIKAVIFNNVKHK